MKKVIFAIVQFVIFLFVFFIGSMLPLFHLEYVLIATPGSTRIFIADGLLLAFSLFVIIVLVEVMRKRLRTATPWTTVAFVLAVVFGLMMKFGFLTRSAF